MTAKAKILDTTVGENGAEQVINDRFLRDNIPLRLHFDVGSGDTLQVQGRVESSDNWDNLYTVTTEQPIDVYPSKRMRVIRTVDGGTEDSVCYVQNQYEATLTFTTHE
jgi:hypothetical protein